MAIHDLNIRIVQGSGSASLGGCISGPGFNDTCVTTAESGDTLTLLLTPSIGYSVSTARGKWVESPTNAPLLLADYFTFNGDNSEVSFVMPEGATSIYIYFYSPEYCLTTSVKFGSGYIQQSGCDSAWKPNDDSSDCAANHTIGTVLELVAKPEEGWLVGGWEAKNIGGTSLDIFTNFGEDSLTATIIMPIQDVYVTVSFIHPSINLILEVNNSEGGCISIHSPSEYSTECYRTRTVVDIPSIDVQTYALPDDGYEIEKWELDGIDQSTTNQYLNLSLDGHSSRTVKIYFVQSGDCDRNRLHVIINGEGTVSPSSGLYCDYTIVSLNPIPSNGYVFSGWEYTDNDISLNGILLSVPMSVERYVTANFSSIIRYESPDSTLFYCPSANLYQSNIVSFDYTNESSSADFHFRVNFYSDSSKQNLIYSAFSSVDNKRWYYDDGAVKILPSQGISIASTLTRTIIYDPEMLPIGEIEEQIEQITGVGMEIPLLCGIRYYVDVEAYNTSTSIIEFVKTIGFISDCQDDDAHYWSDDKDKNNWICSGQGKGDLKIASSIHQSLFTAIDSNEFGMFEVVWQDVSDGGNYIYGATWDSENDKLYCSGQGLPNHQLIAKGYRPMVIADQSSNFYISSFKRDDIYYRSYVMPVSSISFTDTDPGDNRPIFSTKCYPGEITNLDGSFASINARVYEEDQKGSLIVNKDKILPIITEQDIRLEINGIQGAYAVRIRSSEDSEWGDWINIDSELNYVDSGLTIEADDNEFSAYKIDNDRFIVSYKLSRINGLRRICYQILTMYGITTTNCLEVFLNQQIIQYIFEFYKDSGYINKFSTYNGSYVVSEIRDDDGVIIGNQANGSTLAYFKTIFNEDVSYSSLTCNVIQQGTEDIWGEELTKFNNKEWRGSFLVKEHDGVFNKDGQAFIQLVFKDGTTSTCGSDEMDIYNKMINDTDAKTYQNLSPEEIYRGDTTEEINKAMNIESFRQYYKIDDANFKFGNPNIYKND